MKRLSPVVAVALVVPSPGVAAELVGLGLFQAYGVTVESQVPAASLSVRGAPAPLTPPDRTFDSIRYDSDNDPRHSGALVDWYPGVGGLRLSGGVRLHGSSIEFSSTPSQMVTLGGTTYAPSQVGRLSGAVDFNRFAPYLGIGWQGAVADGRVMIGLDFGALYQGRPDVRLAASGATANPVLAADVSREAAKIEAGYGGLRISPVISLTFTYRF